MIHMKSSTLAVGLVACILVSAATAKTRGHRPGYDANAQAIGSGVSPDSEVSPERAKALRECSDQERKYPEHSWAIREIDEYRTCMSGHGQME